jgi:hypothetical protein
VHDWKGLAVTDYRLVVDVGSAIDTENQWAPLGAISLGSKGVELSVLTKDYHGFPEKVGLQLGIECPAISPSLQASFTRWAFQIGDEDRPQHLWFEAHLNEND